jgi:hypothetical protein
MAATSEAPREGSLASAGERAAETPGGNLLQDLGNLYLRPGALFRDLARQNRYVFALVVLICLQLLYACAVISTGVLDYEVTAKTQHKVHRLLRTEGDEDPRKLAQALQKAQKEGDFAVLWGRLLLVLGGPVGAVCFVVVALKGGKPDFPLLAGVLAFAAYVEVPKLLVRLLLVSQLQTSAVETSAAVFAGPNIGLAGYVLLRRLDPFDIWYWCLVGLGLYKTGQLSARSSTAVACALAVLTALVQSAGDILQLTR